MSMNGGDSKSSAMRVHNHPAAVAAGDRAQELRVTLDRLFGEHSQQKKAVDNVNGCMGSFSGFLASATNLPAKAYVRR